ncbi:sir1 [Symbiodinium sp. KB8]|nr:sir1 [Symbiodinium sp. KB8]
MDRVRFKENSYACPYVMYSDKMVQQQNHPRHPTKLVLTGCSEASVYALLLFGGDLEVDHKEAEVKVDGWADFAGGSTTVTAAAGAPNSPRFESDKEDGEEPKTRKLVFDGIDAAAKCDGVDVDKRMLEGRKAFPGANVCGILCRSQKGKGNVVCWSCGAEGHMSWECAKKGKAGEKGESGDKDAEGFQSRVRDQASPSTLEPFLLASGPWTTTPGTLAADITTTVGQELLFADAPDDMVEFIPLDMRGYLCAARELFRSGVEKESSRDFNVRTPLTEEALDYMCYGTLILVWKCTQYFGWRQSEYGRVGQYGLDPKEIKMFAAVEGGEDPVVIPALAALARTYCAPRILRTAENVKRLVPILLIDPTFGGRDQSSKANLAQKNMNPGNTQLSRALRIALMRALCLARYMRHLNFGPHGFNWFDERFHWDAVCEDCVVPAFASLLAGLGGYGRENEVTSAFDEERGGLVDRDLSITSLALDAFRVLERQSRPIYQELVFWELHLLMLFVSMLMHRFPGAAYCFDGSFFRWIVLKAKEGLILPLLTGTQMWDKRHHSVVLSVHEMIERDGWFVTACGYLSGLKMTQIRGGDFNMSEDSKKQLEEMQQHLLSRYRHGSVSLAFDVIPQEFMRFRFSRSHQVHTSLSAAVSAANSSEEGKCWVQTALQQGSKHLAVLLVATQKLGADRKPVSQLEVLRAMEYGGVYVAAGDLESSGGLLKEAAGYMEGPAFVLVAPAETIKGDENWTSFTYDPRKEDKGLPAFSTDSVRVRQEIQGFLSRESLLTLIAKKSLPSATAADGGDAAALSEGLVTILYSSDTGHAEECAKAVARQCRNGGFASSAVRCGTMDSFDVAALLVRSSSYCIFGLGDSHYWGKGTEESKFNFAQPSAKPARDLDDLLEKMGAQRMMPTGFGDDQDTDQYHTGFAEWKGQLFSRLGVDKADAAGGGDDGPVKTDEQIKVETKQLRGSMKESLDDVTTGQIPFQDTKLIKSHGSYQQDDRDLREERQKMGVENAFSFMIRIRLPGGFCTAEQWIAMDDICQNFANGTLKITTRQTWQVHGVLKRNVKATMRAMNKACMDTLAACGDVCRNVLCTSRPDVCSKAEILHYTYEIHDHCLPRSGAYHEIFLMQGPEMAEKIQIMGSLPVEEEPLYGLTYLPRKFKVAVAIPPSNDVDLFAHCAGFIAIIQNGKLLGFNVAVGGGLGFTHNNQKTHPRLADVIGFCKPGDAKCVCECILTVARDFGDRTGRKHARVKYTVEDYGPEWFKEQVEDRLGFKLETAKPYKPEPELRLRAGI